MGVQQYEYLSRGRRNRTLWLVLTLLGIVAGVGTFAALIKVVNSNPTAALADPTDGTSLVVLSGHADISRRDGVIRVTSDTAVRVGDRVTTGAESRAFLTYFDGSTTTLEPETAIEIRRLDRVGRDVHISLFQEMGRTWNRVERLVDSGRFETTTVSGVAFVRGTSYMVGVSEGNQMTVEVSAGTVSVSAAGAIVDVPAGFGTSVDPGKAPSAAVPIGSAKITTALTPTSTPGAIEVLFSQIGLTPTAAPTEQPTEVPTTSPTPAASPTVASTPTATPVATATPTASRTPTPTRPPPPPHTPTAFELEMFGLINAARVERGVSALNWDGEIGRVARAHSDDMVARGFFSHINPEGEDFGDRLKRFAVYGYDPRSQRAENLALAPTVQRAHDEELSEQGSGGPHYLNLVDPHFTRTGVGIAQSSDRGLLITVIYLP